MPYSPPSQTDLVLFPPGHFFVKMLKGNDEVAVLKAVSCFMRKPHTRIHFKWTLLWHLSDQLKNYFRVIRNLRTFLAGDCRNRANTHRKLETTSPTFSGKTDLNVSVDYRQSIKSSNCGRSFRIQCNVNSLYLVALVEAISTAGGTRADSYMVEFPNGTVISKFLKERTATRDWPKFSKWVFRKLFIPFDFELECPEILVEWNAPFMKRFSKKLYFLSLVWTETDIAAQYHPLHTDKKKEKLKQLILF